jgi:hypothetical protein
MRAVEDWPRISLAEVEARAALLDRLETKYVVDPATLERALDALAGSFDVLEVGGRIEFAYDTVYFDTPDLAAYRDHARGRRRRVKARSRRYVDSDLCFVEVKLKGARDRTLKDRLRIDAARHGRLDDGARRFIGDCVQSTYGHAPPASLDPVMSMRFRRTTLVGRAAPERVTIDHGLEFIGPDGRAARPPAGVHVVEIKSETGRGSADRALRRAGARGGRCSKYCVGLNLLRPDLPYNAFKTILERSFGWSAPGGAVPAV